MARAASGAALNGIAGDVVDREHRVGEIAPLGGGRHVTGSAAGESSTRRGIAPEAVRACRRQRCPTSEVAPNMFGHPPGMTRMPWARPRSTATGELLPA